MPIRPANPIPQSTRTNKGWETSIPLTYGSRYPYLRHTREYAAFCDIVEQNRKGAAERKHETLLQRAAKVVAQNLSRLDAGGISGLPEHLLGLVVEEVLADPQVLVGVRDEVWDALPLEAVRGIWDGLYSSQQLTLHLWKPLSRRLRTANYRRERGKELGLYRFERVITPFETSENWEFGIYTQPLISPTFEFIASLSIGMALPMLDYIRLSSIVNLGTLEISDKLGYSPMQKAEGESIDLDRLFRAWAARAENGAFRLLRCLRVDFRKGGLGTDVLGQLDKFSVLGVVYPGARKWERGKRKGKAKMKKGGYVSDYDERSIGALLPRGWKGVRVRGTADAVMNGRHDSDSIQSSAVVENGKRGFSTEDSEEVKHQIRSQHEQPREKITTTPLDGRSNGRHRSHSLHEVLHSTIMKRLAVDPESVAKRPCLGLCVAPDAPAAWHGHVLVDFPHAVPTRAVLDEALEKLSTTDPFTTRIGVGAGGLREAEWRLHRRGVMEARENDGGDQNYQSTEGVMLKEFGMLGLIRLDADMKAVGMDCGPAMLCGDGGEMLGVESKVPVVSLRIGEEVGWGSVEETEMVLLREELPAEQVKERAEMAREGKEEGKAGSRPQRKKEKEELKARVGPGKREEMGKGEGEKPLSGREKKVKGKNKAKDFDKNFWDMIGMAPPEHRHDP